LTTTTDTGLVISYIIFLSIFIFFAPVLQSDILSIDSIDPEGLSPDVEAGIFQVVISFINDLINRFSILISISTSNPIVGIFLGGYTVGFIWALSRLIAEALP
jgi:hypothetical protein